MAGPGFGSDALFQNFVLQNPPGEVRKKIRSEKKAIWNMVGPTLGVKHCFKISSFRICRGRYEKNDKIRKKGVFFSFTRITILWPTGQRCRLATMGRRFESWRIPNFFCFFFILFQIFIVTNVDRR